MGLAPRARVSEKQILDASKNRPLLGGAWSFLHDFLADHIEDRLIVLSSLGRLDLA